MRSNTSSKSSLEESWEVFIWLSLLPVSVSVSVSVPLHPLCIRATGESERANISPAGKSVYQCDTFQHQQLTWEPNEENEAVCQQIEEKLYEIAVVLHTHAVVDPMNGYQWYQWYRQTPCKLGDR